MILRKSRAPPPNHDLRAHQKPLKTYGKSNISGGGLAKEMARVAKEMARGAKEMVRGAKEMARGAKEMEGSAWRSKEMLKNL